MADIFLSYARKDQLRIEPLAKALEAAGFSVWWDRDIETGASFSKTIEQELNAAKAIIVAWSASANESEWVRDEASFARKHSKLFPIRLDACDPPLGFQQIQSLNFSKWRGGAAEPCFQSLLRDVRHPTGRAFAAPPSAPAKDLSPLEKIRDLMGRRSRLSFAAAIAVAAGVAIYFSINDRGAVTSGARTEAMVAVLPFKVIGSGNENSFAVGLHSDLLTRLSKLNAFSVISQSSMREYADTEKNVRQIGAELQAGFILDGTIQTIEDRIRINAQLIDAKADKHLWAQTFDRNLTVKEILDIQAEIAVAIASSMNVTLSAEERVNVADVPTQNIIAYRAHLEGLEIWDNKAGGLEEKRRLVAAFERAVQLDPEFALAWTYLAKARTDLAEWENGDENWAAALAAIETARALEPGLPETEIALAYYLFVGPHDYEKSLAVLEDLDGRAGLNTEALRVKSNLYRLLGRRQEAYDTLLQMQRLAPRNIRGTLELIMISIANTDCENARWHTEAALQLREEFDPVRSRAAYYELSCTGDAARANALLSEVELVSGFSLWLARQSAMMSRDFTLAEKLAKIANPEEAVFGPITDQLYKASALLLLTEREDEAAVILHHASDALEALKDNKQIAGGEFFAQLNAWCSALQRDTDATQYWTKEWKRIAREASAGGRPPSINEGHVWNQAIAGLQEAAIADLRMMLEAPGGRTFRFVDAHPAMDGLRSNPDYIELQKEFGGD